MSLFCFLILIFLNLECDYFWILILHTNTERLVFRLIKAHTEVVI